MTNMFTSYETASENVCCNQVVKPSSESNPKLITNIKGEFLGVQVDQTAPLQLYFHLENIDEVENFEDIIQGRAIFEIITTTHKVITTKDYSIDTILDQTTNDLCITLAQEEMSILKKETYSMRVTIMTATKTYVVFTENDGYLIIR